MFEQDANDCDDFVTAYAVCEDEWLLNESESV